MRRNENKRRNDKRNENKRNTNKILDSNRDKRFEKYFKKLVRKEKHN